MFLAYDPRARAGHLKHVTPTTFLKASNHQANEDDIPDVVVKRMVPKHPDRVPADFPIPSRSLPFVPDCPVCPLMALWLFDHQLGLSTPPPLAAC